ncbi:MAG: hypothetical protein Solumvirus1_58 [Solumvirus sp.]|uniref:Uncharacterized protein n=1 Tax=Solumvirus sp. TaxID=2487773 RepID=A0A3G5AJN1_9VIRU|nr:MAG: hypothetical protein Solumvirus1_58 [Solumvirus sp.]
MSDTKQQHAEQDKSKRFTLPEYTNELHEYLPIPGVVKITEEYLLDTQFIVSKIFEAANFGVFVSFKKYYTSLPNSIKPYLTDKVNFDTKTNIQPRQDILSDTHFAEEILNLASYHADHSSDPKVSQGCTEITRYVSSILYRLKKRSVGHIECDICPVPQLSIKQCYNRYSGLTQEERKELIRGIIAGKDDEEQMRSEILISEANMLITLYLAFKDEIKANTELLGEVVSCINTSNEWSFCYHYYHDILDIISKERFINKLQGHFMEWSDMPLLTYFGVDTKHCLKHNAFTLTSDECYNCKTEEEYRNSKKCKYLSPFDAPKGERCGAIIKSGNDYCPACIKKIGVRGIPGPAGAQGARGPVGVLGPRGVTGAIG